MSQFIAQWPNNASSNAPNKGGGLAVSSRLTKTDGGVERERLLGRALEFDPKFIDPEYPFRWAGVYHLTGEFYDLRLHGVPFPKVKMVMVSLPEGSGIDELRDDVTLLFSQKDTPVQHGSRIRPRRKLLQLQTKGGGSVVRVEIDSPGRYALFVEKSFEPHQFALCGAPGTVDLEQVQIFKPDHERRIP